VVLSADHRGLAFNLNANYGVVVAVSCGPSSISLPRVPLVTVLAVVLPHRYLPGGYNEGGVAREFAEKHGYEIDPNQELNAHGITNVASGLFGGMIAGGGMSASAVKEGAGARTQIANLVAWVVTLVTLLFLTPCSPTCPRQCWPADH
jgi:MFS superfamily sulfate permease-like transporter